MLYTASDFPRLAEGVDPGLAGLVSVNVWAPPGDEWRLTTENGTLTLTLKSKAGDPEPRWQTLGKMNLAKGAALKVVVTKDVPKDDGPSAQELQVQDGAGQAKTSRAGAGPLVAFLTR